MNLLLDTHVWLWLQVSPGRIRPDVLALLHDRGNRLVLSAASAWEIAIKYALGKLALPEPPSDYVSSRLSSGGVESLAVNHRHALRVASLAAHHNDPFDRLLIGQASIERLTIVTADQAFERYDVSLLPLW